MERNIKLKTAFVGNIDDGFGRLREVIYGVDEEGCLWWYEGSARTTLFGWYPITMRGYEGGGNKGVERRA